MERTIERTDVLGTAIYRRLLSLRWGAIIAGVLCALAIQVTLGLFGVGFGFYARPGATEAWGLTASIWSICVPLVACLFGAWLAVRLASTVNAANALVHGLLVWCIGLLCGALFLSASLMGSLPNVGSAVAQTPRAQVTLRSPTLRAMRANEIARGAAASSWLGGLSALLGLGGALIGSEIGRRMLIERRREVLEPTYEHEEFVPPSVTREESVPPDVPRH